MAAPNEAPNQARLLGAHELTAKKYAEIEQEGRNIFHGAPLSAKALDITKNRQSFPVIAKRQELLDSIHDNPVTVFTAATGAGKSTQVPQLVLLDFGISRLERSRQRIVVTQPRRMATEQVGCRLAEECDVDVGNQIGYTHRGAICLNQNGMKSLLITATDGLVLAHATNPNAGLHGYKAIIIDEAHERTEQTDLLLAFVKAELQRREDLKLIIMSATLDAMKFQRYFDNATLVECEGRTFPVEVVYLKDDQKDKVGTAALTVINIHASESDGDILVFVSNGTQGNRIIKDVDEKLAKCKDVGPLITIPCYGSQDQDPRLFRRAPLSTNGLYARKCILATNIAETSITIDGLTSVIDLGERVNEVYDARGRYVDKRTLDISKAQADQRKGRAGRTRPGKCYRLYTKAHFDQLAEQNTPPIMESSAISLALKIMRSGRHLLNFDYLEAPASETVLRSLEEMHYLNYMDDNQVLTGYGANAEYFAVKPHRAKVLVQCKAHDCSADVLDIIAMLEAAGPIGPWALGHRKKDIEEMQEIWRNQYGDLFTLLFLMHSYRNALRDGSDESFLDGNKLSRKVFREANRHRLNLGHRMRQAGITLKHLSYQDPEYYTKIIRRFCAGYFMNSARSEDVTEEEYVVLKGHTKAGLSEATKLSDLRDLREFIIFDECKNYAIGHVHLHNVTPVRVEWLVEACPKYFDPEHFKYGSPIFKDLDSILWGFTKDAYRSSLKTRDPKGFN